MQGINSSISIVLLEKSYSNQKSLWVEQKKHAHAGLKITMNLIITPQTIMLPVPTHRFVQRLGFLLPWYTTVPVHTPHTLGKG